jgi:uncharacterized protein YbjT (DUF2867 family)
MRVIITGGSGLIGRALTAELSRAGYEVVILSRNPQGLEGLSPNVRGKNGMAIPHRVGLT